MKTRHLTFSLQTPNRELSFIENQAIIEAHNAQPDVTFKMGQTPFADYSASEFKDKVLKYAGKRTLAEKRADKAARARSGTFSIPGVTPSGRLGQENVPVTEYPAAFCLLYTSPSPRDATLSRMPSSA